MRKTRQLELSVLPKDTPGSHANEFTTQDHIVSKLWLQSNHKIDSSSLTTQPPQFIFADYRLLPVSVGTSLAQLSEDVGEIQTDFPMGTTITDFILKKAQLILYYVLVFFKHLRKTIKLSYDETAW